MSQEKVLHEIVNHLPVQPSIKDALLEKVTAEFGGEADAEE